MTARSAWARLLAPPPPMPPPAPARRRVPAPPRGQLVDRAIAAYWKTTPSAATACRPDQYSSRTERHQGRQYVVLSDGCQVAAVYRVRYDGVLRRMKRPPKVISP